MASQLYTNALVYINGALATEENQVSIDREGGGSPVITVAKGWAGVSPGAGSTSVKVRNAVPAAGFDFDAGDAMLGYKEIEISVFAAGKTLTVKGFVMKDSFGHSANSESSYEFDFVGPPAKWK